MSSPSIDWNDLKFEYKYGNIKSVNKFLKNKGINLNGNVSRLTKGWRVERDKFLSELDVQTEDKVLSQRSESEAEIRARQANIARQLQLKAKSYLDKEEFSSTHEAIKALDIGLKEERKALLLDKSQVQANISYDPVVLKTRYAKMLGELSLEGLIILYKKTELPPH